LYEVPDVDVLNNIPTTPQAAQANKPATPALTASAAVAGLFFGMTASLPPAAPTGQNLQVPATDATLLAEKLAALLNGSALVGTQTTGSLIQQTAQAQTPATPSADNNNTAAAAVAALLAAQGAQAAVPAANNAGAVPADAAVAAAPQNTIPANTVATPTVPVTQTPADPAQIAAAAATPAPAAAQAAPVTPQAAAQTAAQTAAAPAQTTQAIATLSGDEALSDETMNALAQALNGIEPGTVADDATAAASTKPATPQAAAATQPAKAATDADARAPRALDIGQQADQAQANAATTGTEDENALMQLARKGAKPADAAQKPAPAQAPAAAPQAPAPVQGNAASATPAAKVSIVNMQMSQQQASSDDGFGSSGQQNQNIFGQMSTTDALAAPTAPDAPQQQGFAQYMAAAGRALPPQTSQMIALQMQRNAAAKVDTFTLQLDPADLGRLDIRMKFGSDGSVKAHLSADKPETLAMLQKDAPHLERVLQGAGLEIDGDSISFDLRQGGSQENTFGGDDRDGSFTRSAGIGNGKTTDTAIANIALRMESYIRADGVNITV
jgi:flagellar hook-length control protein FliK